ncbi:MAG TPA: mucoidy inhibitor MuiA family protein [Anaerolineales bacterium]|nr:mucoidy inhibitor MuiA family protein [Anaerolineales bacterium]
MMATDLMTRVVAAEVYPDRARVTRIGDLTVAAGRCSIRITGLPLAAQPETFRAAGSGSATARLLGVRAEIEQYVDTPAERVLAIQRDLEAAQDEVSLVTARIGVFERDVQHLEALAAQAETFARGLALRERTTDQQGAVFDFLQTRRLELSRSIVAARRELRAAERQVDLLKRQLTQATSGAQKQRRVAVVDLDVSRPGALALSLSYVSLGAGWQPRYDLRVIGSALALSYMASVSQTSGEDWNDVALTLSTAQPALSLQVPEIEPWPIGPRPAPPVMGRALMAKAAAPTRADVDMAQSAPMEEAPAPAPLALEAAVVEDAGVSVVFRLPSRADIPGGGDPRIVTIAELPLEPRWDYAAAPRQVPAAYRRVRVINATAYTLLPGPVSLFEGDAYLGPTEIELVARGQELELYLGVDDRIRIEAEPTRRDVEKVLLADKRRLRYGIRYTIENLRETPISLQIRDHIPLPRHEQISVKLEAAEPRPTRQDDLNVLTWDIEIPVGGKREIMLAFAVEHPRSMTLVGLPS